MRWEGWFKFEIGAYLMEGRKGERIDMNYAPSWGIKNEKSYSRIANQSHHKKDNCSGTGRMRRSCRSRKKSTARSRRAFGQVGCWSFLGSGCFMNWRVGTSMLSSAASRFARLVSRSGLLSISVDSCPCKF